MEYKRIGLPTESPPVHASKPGKKTGWASYVDGLQYFVIFQVLCTVLFLGKTLSDFFSIPLYFLPWSVLETIELLAAAGMLLGVISGFLLFREGHRRMIEAERRINAAAGEFHEHLLGQFDEWELTPTEKDIALYVIKGFSNLEIASLRGTTESTVKSQVSAIFRKSGVTSRQQLATWAVEDLIEALTPVAAPAPPLEKVLA